MTICIDSQIIVWGIKKQSSIGQEDMVLKAEAFFRWIDDSKHDVIIPTIVVAEVIAKEPTEIRASYLEILNKSFIITNFDTRAALKYADLLYGRFKEVKDVAAEIGVERQRMKADHMIIATAIANGANRIYSYDSGIKSFSTGFIDVQEFPIQVVQRNLFSNNDDTPF